MFVYQRGVYESVFYFATLCGTSTRISRYAHIVAIHVLNSPHMVPQNLWIKHKVGVPIEVLKTIGGKAFAP